MRSSGYESVNREEGTPAVVDDGTMRFAVVASVLGCSVSLSAIAFVVWSLQI